MKKKTKGIALALMMLLLCPNTLFAQNNDNSRSYVGIQGGIPMATRVVVVGRLEYLPAISSPTCSA